MTRPNDHSAEVSGGMMQDGFIMRLLKHAPQGRLAFAAILTGILFVIGVADYLTGPHLIMILFYVVPLVLATAWRGWGAGNMTAVACSLIHSLSDLFTNHAPYTYVTVLNRLFVLAVYLLIARCIAELITLQHQLERRVQERTRELEDALAAQVELQQSIAAASRYERNAIGRELHDGLCQHLAATNIAAGMLAQTLDNNSQPQVAADAHTISAMLVSAIGQTRQIARGLLLASIKPAELDAQIGELCRVASRKYNTACTYTHTGAVLNLNDDQASHLFFIAQEALRNALKHAGAKHVDISLNDVDGQLDLSIMDDGCGIDSAYLEVLRNPTKPSGMTNGAVVENENDNKRPGSGLGLRIIRHRAALIGARLEITSPTLGRKGTRVCCHMPRPRPLSGGVPANLSA